MVAAHLTEPDERKDVKRETDGAQKATVAKNAGDSLHGHGHTASQKPDGVAETPGGPAASDNGDVYADASHWMHSVSSDGDTAESGSKIDFTDIDLSAIEEDEVIPDRGTAHSLGRKVNIVLCALAFIVLFGYLFIAGEGEDTLRALTSFNYAFLLLTLVGIIIYWLLESVSMQLICNSLFKGFSFVKTNIVTVIGQYFNCITPLSSGGQPMQAYYYQRFGLPLKYTMPMLLCRFIVYQLTMTIYAIIVLVLKFNYFMQYSRAIMYLVAIGFLGGFVLIAMLFSLAFAKNAIIKSVTWAINLLGRIGILKHPQRSLANATSSLEESYTGIRFLLKEPALLIKVSLVTFVQLTVYFSLSWVIFAGFGLQANDYFNVVSCQAFVYLIASFVPLPGAIGASEASYITFFNFVFQNSSSEVALSTFIWRAFTFYLPIVVGMILTLLVNKENSFVARWIRRDDTRMAFEDHTVEKKNKGESGAEGEEASQQEPAKNPMPEDRIEEGSKRGRRG